MQNRTALLTILIISIVGIIFSGYLSYTELFAGFCGASELGMGSCTNVFQVPACVYGLVMYLAVFIFSLIGLKNKN
jgi:hypothetical protein